MTIDVAISDLLDWVRDNGILFTKYELVQETPFSLVLKIVNADWNAFAKAVPAAFSYEGELISKAKQIAPLLPLPSVMAKNTQRGFVITRDSGSNNIRALMPSERGLKLLQKSICLYRDLGAVLQQSESEFLNLGVPDWRLGCWPVLYMNLLAQTDFLSADGLSSIELNELKAAVSYLDHLIALWGDSGKTGTLVNTDLHDANILVSDHSDQLTLIDWTESVWAPPQLAIAAFAERMCWRYNYKEADLVQSDKLSPDYVKALIPLFYTFANFRLISAVGEDAMFALPHWRGRVSDGLRRWLKVINSPQ